MKGLGNKRLLISRIKIKLSMLRGNGLSGFKRSITSFKTIDKVDQRLEEWVRQGRHLDYYESTDEILEELDITSAELAFYCSCVLKKKFLTWRKELRINEAKELLLLHPETPACHIGFDVGFGDKSNFRQQFKAIVGCTPTEWRERNLKGDASHED